MQAITFLERLDAYARLMRLDKPIGTLLLLWPTLWALWLAARGVPDGRVLLVFRSSPESGSTMTEHRG